MSDDGRTDPVSMWNQLRNRAVDMTAQLKTKTGQYRNKEFANASMAMCALIAAADGSIDNAERATMSGLITSNEALKVFPAAELTQKFDFYASRLQSNFQFGKLEATQTIAKLRSKPDQARAVIQIGIIIGGADGFFDDHEKAAVREACHTLGIPPQEFDL